MANNDGRGQVLGANVRYEMEDNLDDILRRLCGELPSRGGGVRPDGQLSGGDVRELTLAAAAVVL